VRIRHGDRRGRDTLFEQPRLILPPAVHLSLDRGALPDPFHRSDEAGDCFDLARGDCLFYRTHFAVAVFRVAFRIVGLVEAGPTIEGQRDKSAEAIGGEPLLARQRLGGDGGKARHRHALKHRAGRIPGDGYARPDKLRDESLYPFDLGFAVWIDGGKADCRLE